MLLKNDGAVLPLVGDGLRIAVVGPNADREVTQGGGGVGPGHAHRRGHAWPTGCGGRFGADHVVVEQGCVGDPGHAGPRRPPPAPGRRDRRHRRPGGRRRRRGAGPAGAARVSGRVPRRQHRRRRLGDAGVVHVHALRHRHPPVPSSRPTAMASVDGRAAWPWSAATASSSPPACPVSWSSSPTCSDPGQRLFAELRCARPGSRPMPFERAVAAAAGADAAVVVIGLDVDWEAEGRDRDGLSLPGRQVELSAGRRRCPARTIVAVIAGSPGRPVVGRRRARPAVVLVPGAGGRPGHRRRARQRRRSRRPVAVHDAGSAGGHAGVPRHPAGPRRPPATRGGHLLRAPVVRRPPRRARLPVRPRPVVPATSASSSARRRCRGLAVSVPVTNTGSRAGVEVVQLYVGDPVASVRCAREELRGFAKDAARRRRVDHCAHRPDRSATSPSGTLAHLAVARRSRRVPGVGPAGRAGTSATRSRCTLAELGPPPMPNWQWSADDCQPRPRAAMRCLGCQLRGHKSLRLERRGPPRRRGRRPPPHPPRRPPTATTTTNQSRASPSSTTAPVAPVPRVTPSTSHNWSDDVAWPSAPGGARPSTVTDSDE